MNALRRAFAGRGKILAILGAVVVPLAFAGLAVGAISGDSTGGVPAAVVNNDELIYQTADDGTESPFFAGRQIVTELTGSDDQFDWIVTNQEKAEAALAAGEVYAIVTIPDTFSQSLISLQGDSPRAADIAITTDDAHSYLVGQLSQQLGDTVAKSFGETVTTQFIAGIYTGIGDMGSSLGEAADGAEKLADAAGELGGGLTTIAEGAGASASGASQLSSGVNSYTGGVDSLSSGLASLNAGAAGLTGLGTNITDYTNGVSGISALLAAELAKPTPDPVVLAGLSQQLAGLASGGASLSAGAQSAISGVQGGIAQSASGAQKLSAGSAGLRSGASGLASGLGELSGGLSTAASGASQLADGAATLSSGLRSGADQVPVVDTDAAEATAAIVASPVTVTSTRSNEIDDAAQAVSAFVAPAGLWVGALAMFLAFAPVTRRAFASTASDGRLLLGSLGTVSAIAAAQAVLLVGLLHLGLGVAWSLLPATLGFSLVTALAFAAVHQLLALAFGRAGMIVSLLLLALQLTSTGGLYPVELLAGPYQAISPFLPLTHAVTGMQAILAGGPASVALGAGAALLVFALAAVLLSLAAVKRGRRIRSLAAFAVPATV